MNKDGKDKGKNDTQDINNKKIEKQAKNPLSNSPSDKEHTLKQRNNQELNERNTAPSIDDEIDDMGQSDSDRDPNIIPEDPIEAEQIKSEKLRFGFSFEPKEGQIGDETEDGGDLTSEQRKTGNRYKPSLGVDDGELHEDHLAVDQDLHVTATGHIGMS
ncbi:MAG: hypothetical protein ACR2GN_06650, partial [Bacteroidia bacterium]